MSTPTPETLAEWRKDAVDCTQGYATEFREGHRILALLDALAASEAAREEAERRVRVQAQATSSACFHAAEYAKRAEAAEARVSELSLLLTEAENRAVTAERENVRAHATTNHEHALRLAADAAYAALVARIQTLLDAPYGSEQWGLLHDGCRYIQGAYVHRALTEKEQD